MDDVEKVDLLLAHAEATLIKGAAPSAIASTITKLFSIKEENWTNEDD